MKKFLAALIAVAAVLALTACAEVFTESAEDPKTAGKVNANDFVKITFSGFDTIGTAQFRIDCGAIVKNNRSVFGLSAVSSDEDAATAAAELAKLLKGSLETTEGLSNGDRIGFRWETGGEALTKALEEKYGQGKLTASDFEVTVGGLTYLTEYSLANDHTVSFDGIDGNGTATVRFDGKLPEEAKKYSLTQSEGLKNGDRIEIVFDESVGDYYLSQGKRVGDFSFGYVVEGLAVYITKTDMINADELGLFEPEIADELAGYAQKSLKNGASIEINELFGTLLLCRTENAGETTAIGGSVNRLYMIFRLSVSKSGDGAKTDFFFAPYIDNVACTPEGELPGTVAYHPILPLRDGDPGFDSEDGTLRGFASLEDLWSALCADDVGLTSSSSFEPPPIRTENDLSSQGGS